MSNTNTNIPKYVLPIIVAAQFAGTSVWFAGNAIIPSIQAIYHLPVTIIGSLTTAVQFGFICGTLIYAVLMLADKISPVRLFMFSAFSSAAFNLLMIYSEGNVSSMLYLRFFTGFFLAGVYPVGMKIAADWFANDLGKALGYLVGALVLGTAFPHVLKASSVEVSWQTIMIATSVLSATGGIGVGWLLKDGSNRSRNTRFDWTVIPRLFQQKNFNAAAIGYFGHMWELYTFWAFVPLILNLYNQLHQTTIPPAAGAFGIIGIGTISCIAGGYLSQRIGSYRVARLALIGSGTCCLLAPFLFYANQYFFMVGMVVWSCFVIADSPQFSTLIAKTADSTRKGTALTMVTCIGFAITIISIQLFTLCWTSNRMSSNQQWLLPFLALGPLTGLFFMRRLKQLPVATQQQ